MRNGPLWRQLISLQLLFSVKYPDGILFPAMPGCIDSSGGVSGFFYLMDIHRPGNIEWRPDLETLYSRGMDTFPELIEKPHNFRLRYFLGSLRLLIMGDRKVPSPSTPERVE